jgi:hypothetical protein
MESFAYETPTVALPLIQADRVIRWIVGESFRGMSQSPTIVQVHFDGQLTSDQIAAIMSVLNTTAYGLTVLTDKQTILNNDTDTATIMVSGAVMASDADVSYRVYFTGSIAGVAHNESEWASGTAAVTAGTATLTFKTPQTGSYHIIVRRSNALHIGRVAIVAAAP